MRWLIQKFNALVQKTTKLVKFLLTASFAKTWISGFDGQVALTHCRRKAFLAIVQDELALVPQKLIVIHERRCKTISFPEMIMLYGPNKAVYTSKSRELWASVVTQLSRMNLRFFQSYGLLQLCAYSVDRNGKRMATRYHNLITPHFSR